MGDRSDSSKAGAAAAPDAAAACPACGAVLAPPSRPVCGACGLELGRFDPVPSRRPRLSDAERAESDADRRRAARSVAVVSAVFVALLVLLFALAKRA